MISRVAVLTSRYPAPGAPYNHMFVHARNRWYVRAGVDVETFVPARDRAAYELDGVRVRRMPAPDIGRELDGFDACMIHLLQHYPSRRVGGQSVYEWLHGAGMPVVFFLHGIEVQSIWRGRRSDIRVSSLRSIARWLYQDLIRIHQTKRTITHFLDRARRVVFVAPSRWLFAEAERTIGRSFGRLGEVIPNGIDLTLFPFDGGLYANRSRVLAIRPLYRGGKYAVDLALATFDGWHGPLHLSLYGRGPDERLLARRVRSIDPANVTLSIGFLEPQGISAVHRQHGLYYAVTRMDSQGVSMCEAMASGLPVVSFALDAIPEFVEHGRTGLLIEPYDLSAARSALCELYENRSLYESIAARARKCTESLDIALTTQRELALAQGLGAAA